MIWVYALRPGHLPPPQTDTTGVDGASLWSLAAGEVSALVSTHPDTATIEPTRQAALDHAAVVELAHHQGPVLPARFATTFPSPEGLERALRARRDTLASGLAEVAGHLEYGLRLAAADRETATTAPPPAAATTTGRGYLERLAADQRANEATSAATREALDAVDEAVGAHATDRWQAPTPPTGVLATVAYLVPSQQATAFERAVATLPQRCHSAVVTCTGPWPPYSFTPREGALLDER